ncbi:ATP-binding protein [Mucilaginibacter sp. E4BP6]|uniref:PAS domain-containing sensor histidine kinase n=1 Tax=Mucilaginibacter sp. E4BP6 TaxID=2723089 RepID=UPI0015CC0963|nr:PAS domain-containing sensor histidine kinase [Mucilaginibacter sp. E4BP6]NYE65397.1 signal transduction histidine kinase [Mucilaginibacter sp. E4BP6]
MSFTDDHDSTDSASQFTHVVNNTNAGIWEFNINTNEVKWYDGFYRVLGYEPGEIESSYNYFFEHLLYHGDKAAYTKSITERNQNNISSVQIRLLTTTGYQWFESSSRRNNDPANPKVYGFIVNINAYKITEHQAAQKDLWLNEAGKLAKIALWEIEVSSMNLTLSKEGYDIFEISDTVKLTVDEAISFFEPKYRSEVSSAIENILRSCRAFDLELPFRTAKNRVIWVRFKAMPIIDNLGRCISIRGILQDINESKKRELTTQSSLSLSYDQNKRLQNFAYMVSHNLRSHTGNLDFMVNLYTQTDSAEEKLEVFEHIKAISSSLNTTVKHLEEIVQIQAEINDDKTVIKFETIFTQVMGALQSNITDADAQIEFDFSKSPEINYIPAYLESIFQNLLTNSLKYRQKNHAPLIKCYTFQMNGHIYMIFEDNGIGIDLERYGDKVFGMYKTFHKNTDAKGIGLFITRSQVESLGGTIKIESTVNVGTKFTLKLA